MSECMGTPQQCRPPLTIPTTTTEGKPVHECTYYGGGDDHSCSTATTTVTSVGVPVHRDPGAKLPFTGGDIVGLLVLAAVLISLGLAILRGNKRDSAV